MECGGRAKSTEIGSQNRHEEGSWFPTIRVQIWDFWLAAIKLI